MFRCLVIRHAAAEAAPASGSDAERILTGSGHQQMAQAAAGLARIIRPPDRVVSSPYVRASATADLLAHAFGMDPGVVETDPVLTAGAAPEDLLGWLRQHRGRLVTLVGHEPDLGRFVSLALAGTGRSFYPFHEGDACLIEFPTVPRAGNATLEWAVERKHLALLAPLTTA